MKMARTNRFELPAEVQAAVAQMQDWRRRHKPRTRIPEEIWIEATRLAQRHGVGLVSHALGLWHKTLKQLVQAPSALAKAPAAPAFVELEPFVGSAAVSAGPVVEVWRPDGCRMVLSLHGAGGGDPSALLVAFLGGIR